MKEIPENRIENQASNIQVVENVAALPNNEAYEELHNDDPDFQSDPNHLYVYDIANRIFHLIPFLLFEPRPLILPSDYIALIIVGHNTLDLYPYGATRFPA